jgi:hypothetical protein
MVRQIRNKMNFIFYLFYRFFENEEDDEGNQPYYRTIFMMLSVLIFNLFPILHFLGILGILPIDDSTPVWENYLKIGIFILLPGFIILIRIFPNKEVINLHFEERSVRKGLIIIRIYYVISVILLFLAPLIKK